MEGGKGGDEGGKVNEGDYLCLCVICLYACVSFFFVCSCVLHLMCLLLGCSDSYIYI